jgi:hypothetical protein
MMGAPAAKAGPTDDAMAKQIEGKKLVIGFLAALFGLAGIVFVIGLTGGSKHVPRSAPGVGFSATPLPEPAPSFGVMRVPSDAGGAGPIDHTVHDKKVRDDVRRKLLAIWAQGEGESAAAAREGRFVPAPTGDGGVMDPAYIQEVIRGEYMPMVKGCYEELLARKKDAGGQILAKFSIVGDEKVGGVLEDVTIETDGGLADDKLQTCLRESLLSVAFRPPANRGMVEVHYPITMSPGDD